MKVKLCKGTPERPRAVRDEEPPYELMPEDEPWEVPDTQYWRRRIRDGDVELVDGDKSSGEPQEGASPRRASTRSPETTSPLSGPQRGP